MNTIYNVYARVNEQNKVIKVFSDCFEKPNSDDILIKSGIGDEFVHVGYYELLTADGAHLFKVVKGKMVNCTVAEIAAEAAALPKEKSTSEKMAEFEELTAVLLQNESDLLEELCLIKIN